MQVASPAKQSTLAPAFDYAGLGPRVAAFGLDYLVIAVYLVVLAGAAFILNLVAPTLLPTLFSTNPSAHLTAFLVLTVPVTLYFAVLQSSSWQATWGKRTLGLKVVRTDGARLSFARALARTVLQFIPWELSHTLIWQLRFDPATTPVLIIGGFTLVWVLIGANLVSLLVTRTNQTLYDLIAATLVIHSPASKKGGCSSLGRQNGFSLRTAAQKTCPHAHVRATTCNLRVIYVCVRATYVQSTCNLRVRTHNLRGIYV